MDRDPLERYAPLKPDFFHILLALSDQDRHGYGIIKAVEEATDGRLQLEPSPLYRRLRRMVEDGIVTEAPERAIADADERRRYYRLTPLGRRILRAEAERLVNLAGSAPVRRLAIGGGRPR